MKQSIKFYQPKLKPICSFQDFIEEKTSKTRYIAHCHKSQKKPLKDIKALSQRFFSDNERDELMKLAKNKQQDAFYLGWVRKESFIK